MMAGSRKWVGIIFVFAFVLSANVYAQDKKDNGTVILTTQSYWRAFYTLKTPVIKKGDGSLEEMKVKYNTSLPSKNWQTPDFDDRSWHRSRGGFFRSTSFGWTKWSKEDLGPVSNNGSSSTLALVCVRGKFKVLNPSKVKGLTIDIDFRGGIVVYMNGKEVTRSHLPDGSQKGMLAIADDYPMEAFLNEKGAPLGRKGSIDRLRKRKRRIENIAIPSSLLRKGINVLAIEVHRSAYPSEYMEQPLSKFKRDGRGLAYLIWSTCDLTSIRLSAVEARGLEPNVFRPSGFQVWNSDLLYPDGALDYGNPIEPLEPITIVGTRNGAFSGKVVLGCTDPIKGLKATISNLKQSGGTGKIPASSIQIRYAMRRKRTRIYFPKTASDFDPLLEHAPDEVPVHEGRHDKYYEFKLVPAAVVPIWLTVKVPAQAQPGDYQGSLTITAGGLKDVKVPVNLKICAFKLPDPQDFHTFTELVASPDSVALYYEVPLWSDRHFQLMERTFKWLGEIGNRTVYIPLIAQTNFGNAETMVRWIKKKDGTYKHDFTIMNKYLDMVEKFQGKPKIVILYVWDVFLEGGNQGFMYGEDIRKKAQGRRIPQVSLLDPETGKVSYEELPQYTNKEVSMKIWRPLITELKKNLKKRGLEKAVMLGMIPDRTPTKEVVSFFRELLPQAPWVRHSHSHVYSLKGKIHGQLLGYQAAVWSASFIKWPELKSKMGWKKKDLLVQFQRGKYSPLALRMIGEMNISGGQRGFGRFGADFWPVLKDKKGRKTSITGYHQGARYPQSNWGSLEIQTTSLLAPGPEGAVATVRFEMMREGVQECEARIAIERALADGKISGDRAERCQKMLDQRTHAMLLALLKRHLYGGLGSRYDVGSWAFRLGECWFLGSNWQKRSEELYTLGKGTKNEN